VEGADVVVLGRLSSVDELDSRPVPGILAALEDRRPTLQVLELRKFSEQSRRPE